MVDWKMSWSNYGENELAIFDGNYIKIDMMNVLYMISLNIKVNINGELLDR